MCCYVPAWFGVAATWIGRRRARFSAVFITRLYRTLAVLALVLAIAAAVSLVV